MDRARYGTAMNLNVNGKRFNHALTLQTYSKLAEVVLQLCPGADIQGGRCFAIGDDTYVGVADSNGHLHVFGTQDPEAAKPICQVLTEPELRLLVMRLATRI
jgi:hypothetical protein